MPDGSQTGLLELRLRSVTWEAEDINSYEFVAVAGLLPAFEAGSHLDLHLPDGLVRSYSLLNDPRDRERYVVAVHNDLNSRGGSRQVHKTLRVGAILRASTPRNSFPLHEDAPYSVLIAGGIGITPLLCMVERLATLGRPWRLHYATSTRARCAFRPHLEHLAGDNPGRLHIVHDGEPGGERLDLPALVAAAPADAHLYCCGPAPMLAAFGQAAASRSATHVHVEHFAAHEEAATDGGYAVVLGRSRRRVPVAPGQTMLAALLDAGASVNYSCSEGVCGTCETRVLSGVPDHRDNFLTDDERAANATVMVCCSGSKTPELILDL